MYCIVLLRTIRVILFLAVSAASGSSGQCRHGCQYFDNGLLANLHTGGGPFTHRGNNHVVGAFVGFPAIYEDFRPKKCTFGARYESSQMELQTWVAKTLQLPYSYFN